LHENLWVEHNFFDNIGDGNMVALEERVKFTHFYKGDVLFRDFPFEAETIFELAELANEFDPLLVELLDACCDLSLF
jgi:hypothetical protein